MPNWLIKILTSAATVGAASWLIQQFVVGKIKYEFDAKLEKIKPLGAGPHEAAE